MATLEEITINTKQIKLSQFLKWSGIVGTGGEAKSLIENGQVKVNGKIETTRGFLLSDGDLIQLADCKLKVVYQPEV